MSLLETFRQVEILVTNPNDTSKDSQKDYNAVAHALADLITPQSWGNLIASRISRIPVRIEQYRDGNLLDSSKCVQALDVTPAFDMINLPEITVVEAIKLSKNFKLPVRLHLDRDVHLIMPKDAPLDTFIKILPNTPEPERHTANLYSRTPVQAHKK